MYYCDRCNKQFSSKKALFGHKAHCMKNKEICPICGKEVEKQVYKKHVKSHKSDNYCLECGKRIPHNKKFCNSSCAATYNNKRHPKRKRENICYCKNCGKELGSGQKSYCNNKCQKEYQYKTYIERWKDGLENGLIGKYALSGHIKKYIRDKFDNKCCVCGWHEISEFTKKVPLEIHHIDGNYKNNSEDNLQLLCPNCHSLTKTYKGANRGKGRLRSKYY